jgi:hypothetical protein
MVMVHRLTHQTPDGVRQAQEFLAMEMAEGEFSHIQWVQIR